MINYDEEARQIIMKNKKGYWLTQNEIVNELREFYKWYQNEGLVITGANCAKYRRGWLMKADWCAEKLNAECAKIQEILK